MWMESYEEFCLRSVAALQEDRRFKRATREPIAMYSSVIVSCGKAALSPLLNAEQRQQMRELRRRAARLEMDRHNQRGRQPSAQIRNPAVIRAGCGPVPLEKETQNGNQSACEKRLSPSGKAEKSPSPKATTLNGYTLVADAGRPGVLLAGGEVRKGTDEKSDERDVRAEEDVKRRPQEDVAQEAPPAPLAEKEMRRPKSALVFGFSLRRSPVGPPETPFHPKPQHPESPTRVSRGPETPPWPGPAGQRADSPPTFRRRCHTLDGQPRADPSQERTPRFMAGVVMRASNRRSWAAAPDEPFPSEKPRRPPVCQLGKAPDDPQRPRQPETSTFTFWHADESQRRARVLEDGRRHLEEAHAFQMAPLLAQQEKEQRRLRLELEESERRVREQESVTPQARDSCQWRPAPANDPLAAASPTAGTAGHRQGLPRPAASNATSPGARPPVRLGGPARAAHEPQALKAEKQRASCRMAAIARGFLVRRLLKTRKVQHLRQTVTDTREFIHCFRTEAWQKGGLLSAQDLSLRERVGAQLHAALDDIHQIFFEIPAGDRLALLRQDRELCAEKKQRDEEKAKKEKERAALSVATQRSLERKNWEARSPGQAGKATPKPKSPTPGRVPKASQVQKCVPSQLDRHGSWSKKAPEARAKRADNLKKQHSLG
ncbi:serine/arginine repetitive matrix protein 1-like isoform X2 [Hippocampus zosterae]|uniref:serine/arginine repetitive matrix protein 1-like isoform X2 n=1 Tax=Hippocampus zosterae TaxID=109293 RepID=UPI00223DD65E|nr:serine/arginine repetitive matrix protein 1-like isoform X2 [Hippocampus zosterae]